MSKNFVLVQYGNQTRKIQGDPRRKKYNALVRQIQDKFDIDFDIQIQVFDKENNQYFFIDSSEVREIQNGGKIKVSKAKGSRGSSPKKNKSSPMKPPGVPPPTKEDDAKRSAWKVNSRVEIYSESELKWIAGTIIRVYNDREGEWLVIRYAAARTKEIQRFSNYIRPVQSKKKKKQKEKQEKSKKKDTPKKEKKEPKPPKVAKVTTQSKYKKVKRAPPKDDTPENVVEFKGNNAHIKQYIDRACLLLRGPKEVPEEEVKADEDEKDEKMESSGPSKKYDVVHLYGVGRAMSLVVSAAEIVKRIVPGLHQETKMEVQELVDVYEPTEAGLKNVEVSRSITGIRVTLAVSANDVDTAASGYQKPEEVEDGFGKIDYKYPDEVKPKRKGRKKAAKGGKK